MPGASSVSSLFAKSRLVNADMSTKEFALMEIIPSFVNISFFSVRRPTQSGKEASSNFVKLDNEVKVKVVGTVLVPEQ